MKCFIVFLTLFTGITFTHISGQTQDRFAQKKYTIIRDSVEVKNQPVFGFCKSTNTRHKNDMYVNFVLQVTNNSSQLIPDIQTARWNGGIKIYLNGESAMNMSLANFMYGGEVTLTNQASDTWDFKIQVTGVEGDDLGGICTWQWEYMGIKSVIMQVDMNNKTVQEVSEHIKGDGRLRW